MDCTMSSMPELPAARLRSRGARDRLAVASAHLRRGARHAPAIARLLWTCLLFCVAVAWILSCFVSWTVERRELHELPELPELPAVIELRNSVHRFEIVEVPAPDGRGTIRTFARKRSAPAAAPAAAAPTPRE
jgi:hypothetical protein